MSQIQWAKDWKISETTIQGLDLDGFFILSACCSRPGFIRIAERNCLQMNLLAHYHHAACFSKIRSPEPRAIKSWSIKSNLNSGVQLSLHWATSKIERNEPAHKFFQICHRLNSRGPSKQNRFHEALDLTPLGLMTRDSWVFYNQSKILGVYPCQDLGPNQV